MARLPSFASIAMIVLTASCTRASFGFRPSLISQVPDSTVVRARNQSGLPPTLGRALGWTVGEPRIVTPAGDTVGVAPSSTLEVRVRDKKSQTTLGGVLGLAVGFSIKLANCPPTNRCPPDVTPAITAGLGALIGSRFKAAEWVRVK